MDNPTTTLPRPFPLTVYDNPPPPAERHYLRISPIAIFSGSPEDVAVQQAYLYHHPGFSASGETFTPYRVTKWKNEYRPDDQKRAMVSSNQSLGAVHQRTSTESLTVCSFRLFHNELTREPPRPLMLGTPSAHRHLCRLPVLTLCSRSHR